MQNRKILNALLVNCLALACMALMIFFMGEAKAKVDSPYTIGAPDHTNDGGTLIAANNGDGTHTAPNGSKTAHEAGRGVSAARHQ